MKIIFDIEVPDDFEPCTYGCDRDCPFGYTDDDYNCVHMYRKYDNYEWTCTVNEAMKKGNETN